MKAITYSIILFSIAMLFFQCGRDDVDLENMQEIEAYLEANNLEAEVTASGLYYIIEEAGGEEKPTVFNQVTVHYEGFFTDGGVFDSSIARGAPSTFPLSGVIQGWQEGIPLFGRGGKGLLLIPSRLAYGPAGRPGIPPNSVLLFNIELINF